MVGPTDKVSKEELAVSQKLVVTVAEKAVKEITKIAEKHGHSVSDVAKAYEKVFESKMKPALELNAGLKSSKGVELESPKVDATKPKGP